MAGIIAVDLQVGKERHGSGGRFCLFLMKGLPLHLHPHFYLFILYLIN